MSPPKHLQKPPPPEKSKFVQTCNRLSLFLKDKSNVRDLNFAKFDATGVARTVDLLSSIDDSAEKKSSPQQAANILPEYVILDSSCEQVEENSTKKAASSSSKPPKTAQMTIFYQGQVLVLDDVPADRARDLMLIAKTKTGQPHPQPQPPKPIEKIENRIELASTSKPPPSDQAKDSDLPIARRASLHKFLAKRKDRAATVVRAPYQLHNNHSPGGSSSGNDHSFDLNT